MPEKIIQLEGVSKKYTTGDTTITALAETSIVIETGMLTLIMGPSGSGKTTLLSIIGFVIYPGTGKVLLRGQNVTTLSNNALADLRLKTIGFVFQHFNLIEPLNALENVMQPLILQGQSSRQAKENAGHLLEKLGLKDRMQNLPKKLSGGQKQRVAIARALVTDPPLVLCDEPTASLDAKSAALIMDELKAMATKGKAVLIVTHDLRLRKYADKVIYVEEGIVSDSFSNEDDYK